MVTFTMEELIALKEMKTENKSIALNKLKQSLPFYSKTDEEDLIGFVCTLINKLEDKDIDDINSIDFSTVIDITESEFE